MAFLIHPYDLVQISRLLEDLRSIAQILFDLAKHAAANIMKLVVGIPGTRTPIKPKATKINPMTSKKDLTTKDRMEPSVVFRSEAIMFKGSLEFQLC